jgi:hypothetical protein
MAMRERIEGERGLREIWLREREKWGMGERGEFKGEERGGKVIRAGL